MKKKQEKKTDFKRPMSIAVFILFSVVTLTILFKVISDNQDVRSKAAYPPRVDTKKTLQKNTKTIRLMRTTRK